MKKSETVVVSDAYIPKKKTFAQKFKANLPLLIMLLPGFLALLLFHYKPMYGLSIAFLDYSPRGGIMASEFVGFENFKELFNNQYFAETLKNTVVISFLRIVCGWPTPIILALLLNEIRCGWFKKLTQTLTYIPHFFSWVVLGGIFKMLFSVEGPINLIIKALGFEAVPFLLESSPFLFLVILTAVWQGMGSGAIVYIAALAGVDESLYEAAYIDGASKIKQVFHITIPSIMGTITTVFIMNLAGVLNAGFDQLFNLSEGADMIKNDARIIDTYSYELLKGQKYEMGTTLGLFKSLVGLVFVLGSNWFVKKISKDEYGIL